MTSPTAALALALLAAADVPATAWPSGPRPKTTLTGKQKRRRERAARERKARKLARRRSR
jgi:hypothetical protein